MPRGVPGHIRKQGVLRILNDCHATQPLDRRESCGSIIEAPGQHNPDRSRSIDCGSRSKERIDGGPKTILLRSLRYMENTRQNDKMEIWRR